MKTLSKLTSIVKTLVLAAALAGAAKPAHAEEIQARKVGVGYKIGNGIGWDGGDVVLRLVPHVAFDLQASYLAIGAVGGYGLAPTIQFQFKEVGHTAYIGIGMQRGSISSEYVAATRTGVVANAGYEWRFASGVGVIVGGGIQAAAPWHFTKGMIVDTQPAWVPHLNLEAGVRYFF